MTASKIEWTDAVWNPVRGCSRVSEGCRNCYAERQAARFETSSAKPKRGNPFGRGTFEGFVRGGKWTGRVALLEQKLTEPLTWREPRRVFVNSMTDLFHESLSNQEIAAVFGVMAAAPQHTFQVLTKRALRMREWFRWIATHTHALGTVPIQAAVYHGQRLCNHRALRNGALERPWPLPNVWLGVSIEDQPSAKRAWDLLQTPAAIRFVSVEPMIGPVDLDEIEALYKEWRRGATIGTYLDWVIVGGESGPGARPCEVGWIRAVADQCRRSRVPVFVKQLGAHSVARSYDELGEEIYEALHDGDDGPLTESDFPMRVPLRERKGGDPHEWPEDLRVREFPEVRA